MPNRGVDGPWGDDKKSGENLLRPLSSRRVIWQLVSHTAEELMGWIVVLSYCGGFVHMMSQHFSDHKNPGSPGWMIGWIAHLYNKKLDTQLSPRGGRTAS